MSKYCHQVLIFSRFDLVEASATVFLFALNMSHFEPEKHHLREALLFCFRVKKNAAESDRLPVEAYGEHALSEQTCREWFRRFKTGDFVVHDKARSGQPKKFEDEELEASLDQDPCQTLL
jgi:hypothetical protein